MEKIVGLIDRGRLIGFWLCLGSGYDLWELMDWKLENILDLVLEKYLKRHRMPELISVRPHCSLSVENMQQGKEREEGALVPLFWTESCSEQINMGTSH